LLPQLYFQNAGCASARSWSQVGRKTGKTARPI